MLIQSVDQAGPQSGTTTIKDALEFLRRRLWLSLSIAAAVIAGAVLLALRLPPVYQSEATILIEQPAIPENIVPTTINSYVEEQIQIVAQHIYTNDSVAALIEKHDLYPEERRQEPMETTVARFVAATKLESISAEVSDERGRSSNQTFAFIVGFKYSDPAVAQKVTADLAQGFLDENVRYRTERASTTTSFLELEAERLADEIAAMEVRIAEFKDEYGEALPEQLDSNMDTLRRTESELNSAEQELRDLQREEQIVRSELQTIDPYAPIISESGEVIYSSEQRLAELRQRYLQLRGRYGSEHPDVKRTKREIEAIAGAGAPIVSGDVAEQIAALKVERDSLLERYSPQHPDVVKLQQAIDTLEMEAIENVRGTSSPVQPNNPTYLQAQARLRSLQSGIAATRERRQLLIDRRERLERNIDISPRIEQNWLQLSRGYSAAKEEYEEIKRRSTAAKLSQRLEAESKGERYTLLKRASLPASPVEPNRPAILFLGIVVAFGAGIGMAALVDAMDTTVRGPKDLQAAFGLKPIGAIPYVRTLHDRRVTWIRRSIAGSALAVSLFVLSAYL
jgi:succinoglycan biosynthesis transport protein ExoP